jgi:NitT/TauT family transport system permease protein
MSTATQPDGALSSGQTEAVNRRWSVPNWMITTISVIIALLIWEYFGRHANPLLATYPTAILAAAGNMFSDGRLFSALLQSSQPFVAGYIAAVALGIPAGLLLGRYRLFEA